MTLDNILEEIKKAETIAIMVHEAPDGDAVGSALAMRFALKQLGKESDVLIPEYSRLFSFLPGTEEIKTESSIKEYDLAISIDCSDLKRLKCGEEYFETAKRKIQIDHHSSNTMFGDLNFVNPDAPDAHHKAEYFCKRFIGKYSAPYRNQTQCSGRLHQIPDRYRRRCKRTQQGRRLSTLPCRAEKPQKSGRPSA